MKRKITALTVALLLLVLIGGIVVTAAGAYLQADPLDEVTITGGNGSTFYPNTAEKYYASWMYAALSYDYSEKKEIDWINSTFLQYNAWCASYGLPVPQETTVYTLYDELNSPSTNGNKLVKVVNGERFYYDTGLKAYISFDWALSCIKAAEKLAKANGHNSQASFKSYIMATELAIRCSVDGFNADKATVSGSWTDATELSRIDWSVKDFFDAVKTIVSTAEKEPYEYVAASDSILGTWHRTGNINDSYYQFGYYDLNCTITASDLSVVSASTTNGIEFKISNNRLYVQMKRTTHNGYINAGKAGNLDKIVWKFSLYKNLGETYNLLYGVPKELEGECQNIMIYHPEDVEINDEGKGEYPLQPDFEKATLVVSKKDVDGNKVSGMSFSLYPVNADGSFGVPDNKITSNTDGIAIWEQKPLGTYFLVENNNPGWSSYNPDKWTVSGAYSAVWTTKNGLSGWLLELMPGSAEATVTAVNKRIVGGLKIQKASDDGVLQGFTFTVTGGGKTYTGTTDASGVCTFSGLPVYDASNAIITYTVTETNVPDRYVKPAAQTVTLTENKTLTVNFNNKLKYGELIIQKDAYNGVIENVGFRVTSTAGYNQTYYTDNEGLIIINRLPVYQGDVQIVYTVTELEGQAFGIPVFDGGIKAADNYSVRILLEVGDNLIKVYNTEPFANLNVFKRCEDGSTESFTFRLTSDAGLDITGTTMWDIDCQFYPFEDLPMYHADGTPIVYTLTELDAPVRYETPEEITVLLTEQTEVTVTNTLKRGSLTVNKVDREGNALADVTFALEKLSGETWERVTELTTGEDGAAVFEELQQNTVYRVVETACPEGYMLHADAVWQGEIGNGGNFDITLTVNDGLIVRLPETGGRGFVCLPIAAILFSLAFILISKRERKNSI